MPTYTIFEIRVPKASDTSPEAMAAGLQALPRIKNSILDYMFKSSESISLEVVTWHQRIYFLAAVPTKIASYFVSQMTAQYPQSSITPVGDYMPFLLPPKNKSQNQSINPPIHPKISDYNIHNLAFSKLTLEKPYYFPIKDFTQFADIDPMSTILGSLAKIRPQDKVILQFLVNSPPRNWQIKGKSIANTQLPTSDPEKTMPHPQKTLIEGKVSEVGFKVGVNLLTISDSKLAAEALLESIAGSFASVSLGEGNSFANRKPFFWQSKAYIQSIIDRKPIYTPRSQVLTSKELATLYHLPNQNLINIKNIAWGGNLKGEPPEALPIASNLTDEQKREINFFAKTEFKSHQTVFGIKTVDRRKHIYIIGKTGVGKSTLIANMAINDMRNGKGMAIIDPHGDLVETVLDYVPKHRLNDVVYLNPNDLDFPFRLNPLEVANPEQADLVASGIVGIFHKLFSYSWGPRLEYILRNTLLTLAYCQSTTLLDVTKILTNKNYRNRIVEEKLQDETLKSFWKNEFGKLDNRQTQEAISPILNKVGQFITSPKIRSILERPHSSVNLEEIMNSGKILLLNLSQGMIGEDNAALLGAMFITKIQLAAMNRVSIPEEQRRDFYLYVDEFQNFATSSFIKILSEARKYRLNLTVANQYTAQVEDDIQKAIFGNVGTLISFLVGSNDALLINKEFGQLYDESDLVNLDNYEIITKLSIDNRTSAPFPSKTLPLPFSSNKNREKAIKLSRERYGKPDKKKQEEKMIPSLKEDAEQPSPQDISKKGNRTGDPGRPPELSSSPSNPLYEREQAPGQRPSSQRIQPQITQHTHLPNYRPTPNPQAHHDITKVQKPNPTVYPPNHGGFASHNQHNRINPKSTTENQIIPISQPNPPTPPASGYATLNQTQIMPTPQQNTQYNSTNSNPLYEMRQKPSVASAKEGNQRIQLPKQNKIKSKKQFHTNSPLPTPQTIHATPPTKQRQDAEKALNLLAKKHPRPKQSKSYNQNNPNPQKNHNHKYYIVEEEK